MAGKQRWWNLKTKFLFVVLVPVLLTFVVIGFYSRSSLDSFGRKISSESTAIVTRMAEDSIIAKARAVAGQLELALQDHPDIAPQDFNGNTEIRDLSIQQVGKTGYTVLWSVPEPGSEVSPTWVHPDSKLVGKDTPPLVKKRLGDRYMEWFNVYSGCYHGKESHGYYLWEDGEGRMRQKFLACVPIPDTLYAVSATTYLDEFLDPVVAVGKEINIELSRINLVYFATMGIGLVAFICCAVLGIQRISSHIVRLTGAIEDVSLGKVEDKIEIIQSGDELQDLSEAFERMRTAVKFMMDKLARLRAKQGGQ